MRPDEEASRAEIERDAKRRQMIQKAATGLSTAALSTRILPLLSEFVPTDFAFNAISRISPQIGSFLKRGKDSGLDLREGLNYLKDSFFSEKPEEEVDQKGQPSTFDERNIIQKYSPELHQFILDKIKSGRSALEAGAMARLDKSNDKIIRKMEYDSKLPWSSILETTYGTNVTIPENQKKTMGEGQAKLAEILEKINKRLGS